VKLSARLPVILVSVILLACGCRSTPKGNVSVKVGALLPLSGDNASFGTTARNAYQIAEQDLKAQGKTPFDLDYGDSRLDPTTANEEFTRLVTQDHVIGFVEVTGSGIALSLAPRADSQHIPLLSAIDTSPLLSTQGGHYFFRVIPSDAYSSKVLTNWLTEKQLKTAAMVVNQQNGWATGFRSAIVPTYRKQGFALPDDAILPVTDATVDFNSAIVRLEATHPQVWFVGLMGRQAGLFVKQAVARGIEGPFVGVDNLDQAEFSAAAGRAASHAWFVLPAEINSAAGKQFAQEYQIEFQRAPDSLAYAAYDAFFVMQHALDAMKAGGQSMTGENLQQTLATTKLNGVTGTIEFDQNHDLKEANYQRWTYDPKGNKAPVRLQ
jgi:branched-chain amino acid transport system substrate-binding protein